MAIDMKKEFLIGYDKVANLSSPGYTDEEISIFLSQAQERIVKRRYRPMPGDSFEETEKRRKELQGLLSSSTDNSGNLKTTVSSNQSGKVSDNSTIFDLPSDLWLPIMEWVVVNSECNEIREVIPITREEYMLQRRNPFLKPNKNKVWRIDSPLFQNTFRSEVITNGDDIVEYHVQYLKKPTDIVVGNNPVPCELHDNIHREIVSEAINIALETSQEPRFQTQTILNNTIE
jgi:hypothetical protein